MGLHFTSFQITEDRVFRSDLTIDRYMRRLKDRPQTQLLKVIFRAQSEVSVFSTEESCFQVTFKREGEKHRLTHCQIEKQTRPENRHIDARSWNFIANREGADIEPHPLSFETIEYRQSRSDVVQYQRCLKDGPQTLMNGNSILSTN